MKITIKVEKEFDAKILKVQAGVRYWEDASVNEKEDTDGDLIPLRMGDCWCPIIDIETGRIKYWPKGTTANIHYKVCDAGTYALLDEKGELIKKLDGYVPKIMCPGDNGYGDYIIMSINEDGVIENWEADLSDFIDEEE